MEKKGANTARFSISFTHKMEMQLSPKVLAKKQEPDRSLVGLQASAEKSKVPAFC